MGRRVAVVSERIFPEVRAIVDAAAAAEDASRMKSSYFGISLSTAAAPADARALALELALLPDLLPGGVSIFDVSMLMSTLGLKALALPGTFLDSESAFGGNRGSGGANESSLREDGHLEGRLRVGLVRELLAPCTSATWGRRWLTRRRSGLLLIV